MMEARRGTDLRDDGFNVKSVHFIWLLFLSWLMRGQMIGVVYFGRLEATSIECNGHILIWEA
jgi:hypothetical protein